MFRTSRLFIVLLVLVFATAAFAFAASNTVPSTYAGEGASVTDGYTVTNVDYNLNATNASNIDNVTFKLSPAASVTSTVKIRLDTAGSFFNCTSADGTNWTCNTPGSTVAATDELRVIATD